MLSFIDSSNQQNLDTADDNSHKTDIDLDFEALLESIESTDR